MADVEMRYPEDMWAAEHAGRLVAPGGVAPRAMPTAEARRLRGSTAESRAAMRSPEGVLRRALQKGPGESITEADLYTLWSFVTAADRSRRGDGRRVDAGVSVEFNPTGRAGIDERFRPAETSYVQSNYQMLKNALAEVGPAMMEASRDAARVDAAMAYTPGPGEAGPQSMPQNPRMGPVKRKHGGGY